MSSFTLHKMTKTKNRKPGTGVIRALLLGDPMKSTKKKKTGSTLRKRAENKLASGSKVKKVPRVDARKLGHELQVHQIELEMQNDELLNANAVVEESRARFSDLYDFAPIGYATLDEKGIVVEANLTLARLMGVERVSLLKKPFQALLFAEDKNAFSTFFQRITSWDAKQTLEVRFAKKDSSYFHAQVEGIGFSDAAGDTQQFLLAILDVTDRKRLEERLFQSEHRFRNLFNSMKEGFVLCEMIYNEAGKPVDFRFIEANPAFALQSGVPIESIPGKLVTEIISEIEPLWIETFGSVVESGQARSINYPIAELEKHYEVHAWRSGPGRFAAVFNDITLRVAAQDLLQHQTDELAVANKELEAFGHSISHDLRNPLHSIIACSELLARDVETGQNSREAIYHITRSAERMSQIITDLLALSRITRQEVHHDDVDLSDIARQFWVELRPSNPGRDIEFLIQPDCVVHADKGLMRNLMENLIRNAWKYTGPIEKAKIEFGAQRSADRIIYFVRDNGVGFDMSKAGKLFQPFCRLHPDKDFKGSGIGLSIVKRIVEKHGGKIWAESEKDKGATFFFNLALPSET
jgi:PAS domain S-box-containing protein